MKYLPENIPLKFLQKYNSQIFITLLKHFKVCQGYIFTYIYKIPLEVSHTFRKCCQNNCYRPVLC